MKRYVIIGNGVAGDTAVEKIRNADPDGEITVFSQEPHPFYYRVRLPDLIADEVDLPRITLHDHDWYRKRNITLHLNERVQEVDMDSRMVKGAKGHDAAFDELLLATGARSFIPPVPGSDKKGVYALRTAEDALEISANCRRTTSAILIGGGLLGLEAGYGLARRGLNVHVVEFFDRLLPRQMDPAGAKKLQKNLEGLGFSFYLGARSKEILGQEKAEGLLLEDGREIPGGMVLFSAGIRPNLDLAQSMGLDTDKGVKVDDRMRTGLAGVWAAGDLIEHGGRIYGIWPAAKEQGNVAGRNMAGENVAYKGTVMANSLKVVGVDLTSAGDIDPDGKLKSATYEDDQNYRKIVIDNGRIAGFIFYGLTEGIKECQAALEAKSDIGALAGLMTRKDFDFKQLF